MNDLIKEREEMGSDSPRNEQKGIIKIKRKEICWEKKDALQWKR